MIKYRVQGIISNVDHEQVVIEANSAREACDIYAKQMGLTQKFLGAVNDAFFSVMGEYDTFISVREDTPKNFRS